MLYMKMENYHPIIKSGQLQNSPYVADRQGNSAWPDNESTIHLEMSTKWQTINI